jgi:hypothetical protein
MPGLGPGIRTTAAEPPELDRRIKSGDDNFEGSQQA